MPKTKADAISAVAEKTGITKAQATVAVDSLLDFIVDNAGEKVAFMGFGSFESEHKPARDAKDPKGNAIKVAAKNVLKFKPGKETKAKLNPVG